MEYEVIGKETHIYDGHQKLTVNIVTVDTLNAIVDDYVRNKANTGKIWMAEEDGHWVVIDDSTGDCWTEQFRTKEDAISWILDE